MRQRRSRPNCRRYRLEMTEASVDFSMKGSGGAYGLRCLCRVLGPVVRGRRLVSPIVCGVVW